MLLYSIQDSYSVHIHLAENLTLCSVHGINKIRGMPMLHCFIKYNELVLTSNSSSSCLVSNLDEQAPDLIAGE